MSEASGTTFTDHVAGDRAILYMVVYSSYTMCVNTRACANGAELAIIFYRERNSDILTWSGFEPGSDALHTTAFITEPMGL